MRYLFVCLLASGCVAGPPPAPVVVTRPVESGPATQNLLPSRAVTTPDAATAPRRAIATPASMPAQATTPVAATSCPRRYADAVGACVQSNVPAALCRYPQGECSCVHPRRPCPGGVPRRVVSEPAEPTQWGCTPTIRSDGCPGRTPRAGETCRGRRSCDYSAACYTLETWSCVDGRWKNTGVHMTPAPP